MRRLQAGNLVWWRQHNSFQAGMRVVPYQYNDRGSRSSQSQHVQASTKWARLQRWIRGPYLQHLQPRRILSRRSVAPQLHRLSSRTHDAWHRVCVSQQLFSVSPGLWRAGLCHLQSKHILIGRQPDTGQAWLHNVPA